MPVTIHWDSLPIQGEAPLRIIRYTFTGHWSWQDLRAALEEGHALMDAAEGPVHVICDVLHSKAPNLDGWTQQVLMLIKGPHVRWSGVVVLVGPPLAFRVMVQQLQFLYPHAMPELLYFAASLDDARALLRAQGQG